MSQEKLCAYCKAKLFEDDDAVFCPICGAAHHRDCYNKLGHCAREELHNAEPLEMDAAEPESTESVANQETSDIRPEGIPSDREGHICSKCGCLSSSDTLFCPYCGASFNEAESDEASSKSVPPPFVVPGINPYGGVDPSGEIEGVPVSEMAIHVRANSHYYLPKFDKLSKKKKNASFNWSAFTFSFAWLFYRKCYFAGIVSILFTIVGYLLTVPYCVTMLNIMEQNGMTGMTQPTQEQYNTAAMELLAQMEPSSWLLLLGAMAVIFIIHLVVGIFGNRIYLNKSKAKINKIKEDEDITDKIQAIAASGGANILSGALIFYIMVNFVFSSVINLFY